MSGLGHLATFVAAALRDDVVSVLATELATLTEHNETLLKENQMYKTLTHRFTDDPGKWSPIEFVVPKSSSLAASTAASQEQEPQTEQPPANDAAVGNGGGNDDDDKDDWVDWDKRVVVHRNYIEREDLLDNSEFTLVLPTGIVDIVDLIYSQLVVDNDRRYDFIHTMTERTVSADLHNYKPNVQVIRLGFGRTNPATLTTTCIEFTFEAPLFRDSADGIHARDLYQLDYDLERLRGCFVLEIRGELDCFYDDSDDDDDDEAPDDDEEENYFLE
jgi:hypothetical protein